MQPGELLVARLKGGATVAQYIGRSARSTRVRITAGRKRTADIPLDRVVLATGLIASGEDGLAEFQHRCDELASEIDLTEVWEVVREESASMTLDELAELHWGSPHDLAQRVALLLHLDRTARYFVADKTGYTPRSQDAVREAEARQRREAENAQAAASLMDGLAQGVLPQPLTRHQSTLLEHLRGYAVHGENYTRGATAQNLLEKFEQGTRDHQRLSFELLVRAGVLSPDEPLELERLEIPREFGEDTLAEVDAIDLSGPLDDPRRRDLSAVDALTIDDATTEDRDDALSLEVDTGPPTPVEDAEGIGPVYRVGVHIADAGALIPRDGAIDREADLRMASLYLPERKIPMLPPKISDRMGSLAPGEKRAALSLLARVTESGDVLDWEVTPSVVHSEAALSYEEADDAIADTGHPWHQTLAAIDRVAASMRRRREEAGAVVLERPEMSIALTESGDVEVGVLARTTPARQMVAELMILCNSLLAEYCRREGLPAAYRTQDKADLDNFDADIADGPLRRHMVIRRMPPADVGTVPAPHGGLGVPAYVQATSPLRRYSDLIMQRQISGYLRSGQASYSKEVVASVAHRSDVQVRELARLEEDRKRHWFLKYLKQSLAADDEDGVFFQAIVLDNPPRRGALLELAEYPFRFRAELPGVCAPGETVTLRLRGVDLWQRVAQFVHVPPAG